MSWYAAAIAAGGAIANTAINVNRQNAYQRRSEHLSREMARNSIQYKVQDAIKAGIHPLYAIGAPTINSPTFSFMPTDNLSQGASQIANMVYDKESKDLNNDLLKQQIESVKLQNAQRQLEISAMSSKPSSSVSAGSPVGSKTANFDDSSRGIAGLDKKVEQYLQAYQVDDKTFDWKPNQQLIDMISDDFREKAVWYNKSLNYFSDDNWEFWHEQAERLTSKLHHDGVLPRTYIVVADYSLLRGGFYARLHKISSSRDYLKIPFMDWKRSKSYKFFKDPF